MPAAPHVIKVAVREKNVVDADAPGFNSVQQAFRHGARVDDEAASGVVVCIQVGVGFEDAAHGNDLKHGVLR